MPELATLSAAEAELKFRDPARARGLAAAIARTCNEIGRSPIAVMHVCGSHEQAIARFGLRTVLPRQLEVIMGPGCPVCVTDLPEVDEAVALAEDGAVIVTYGDMMRVPGSARSLAEAQAMGARVEVIYGAAQAVDVALAYPDRNVVFFASGFETTAVTTAAIALRDDLPANFSILSAHKYIPPAMEIVASMPGSRIEGFIAAGHAATITGWGAFEPFVARHGIPVVVAGFEPLDILAALEQLLVLIRDGDARVVNAFPRCVTREGNTVAQEKLWRAFRRTDGRWRGIAEIPDGNLRLRDELAHLDARRRFTIDLRRVWASASHSTTTVCICGEIMTGTAAPTDCPLFGKECLPDAPLGACMVSSEGACRIWHTYGGVPAP